ncbi:MAG: hypothetical protein EBU52_20305, partial [Cytophagia bacterium]|nr:hypothetical protein [Cytophagia bacterium]
EVHLWSFDKINNAPNGTILRNAAEVLPEESIFTFQGAPVPGIPKGGIGSLSHWSDQFQLKVLYKEREEALYAMGQRRPPQRFQESVVHFTDDELKIYPNGYYEDVRSLFMQGYLGWSGKIAEMLPTDYKYEVK